MSDYLSIEDHTGLEFLQKLIDEKRQPPMARLMGFALVEVSDGRAVFEATVNEDFYNPLGNVHGGYAATLLDSALGCAIQTKLPENAPYGTIELKVNYIRTITKDTGLVRAVGKPFTWAAALPHRRRGLKMLMANYSLMGQPRV